jgi:hypothetical protein
MGALIPANQGSASNLLVHLFCIKKNGDLAFEIVPCTGKQVETVLGQETRKNWKSWFYTNGSGTFAKWEKNLLDGKKKFGKLVSMTDSEAPLMDFGWMFSDC